ncbi:hypothetical protein PAXRUDRAFT_775734 [Paxillus rubicundulus Ve08.2h10]|uniref:Uncharacterized protein n=1 Tax=Paxillus rubicundulus Ve08.2h10 TaxID=930991 RepID=A0A0D0DZ96_9AGAM|nr:hypothetical protein PAXRUDRAFT_775734 [Paxillus rubicundulus Ve08.2h10]
MNYLSSVLAANPSLYLDEPQDCLSESCDVDVSIATTWPPAALIHSQTAFLGSPCLGIKWHHCPQHF